MASGQYRPVGLRAPYRGRIYFRGSGPAGKSHV